MATYEVINDTQHNLRYIGQKMIDDFIHFTYIFPTIHQKKQGVTKKNIKYVFSMY